MRYLCLPITDHRHLSLLASILFPLILLAMAGCVREVPGTTCDTTQDCYLGSVCQAGICMPGEDLIDMTSLDADPDSPDQGDMKTPDADLSTMPDTDLPDTPGDMKEAPDLSPDLTGDMQPPLESYTIAEMAILPGPRAAIVQDNIVWVLTSENTTNSLVLSRLDPITSLPTQSYPIASDLEWSVVDTTEKAALFSVDSLHIGILYESHAITGKIELYYASFDISNGAVTSPTLVTQVDNLDSPTLDFDLHGALPTVLVNPAGTVSLLDRDNDSWVERTSISLNTSGQLRDPHFITDQNAVCGHINNDIACFFQRGNGGWDEPKKPKISNIDALHVARDHRHAVLVQGESLRYGTFSLDPGSNNEPIRLSSSTKALAVTPRYLSVDASLTDEISVSYSDATNIFLLAPLNNTTSSVLVTENQDFSALTLFGTQPHVFTSDAPTSTETSLFVP